LGERRVAELDISNGFDGPKIALDSRSRQPSGYIGVPTI
jgi:hypothetical protein